MRRLTFRQRTVATRRAIASHSLSVAILLALIFAGCASPGAPVTRESEKPQEVKDLSASQLGNSIVLSFTLPKETVRGGTLNETPSVQVYRAFENAPADAGKTEKPRLLITIPSQMLDRYEQDGRVVFPDMLTPEELAAHSGTEAVYEVRTRVGRSSSGWSNSFRVRILAVPQPIQDLRAQTIDGAVEVAWSAPQIVGTGSEQPALEYEVYREEVSGGGTAQKSQDQGVAAHHAGVVSAEFNLFGQSSQPSYMDRAVESGRTYAYVVRSTAKYASGSVESQDSNRVEITFSPISPPAEPEHLVGTITSGNGPAAAVAVELSWAISPETDVAGYNVYRSDMESGAGTRVNRSLVLVPVFRDSSVEAGQQYFYHVTAVNRTGNESEPSAAIAVTVPESK